LIYCFAENKFKREKWDFGKENNQTNIFLRRIKMYIFKGLFWRNNFGNLEKVFELGK